MGTSTVQDRDVSGPSAAEPFSLVEVLPSSGTTSEEEWKPSVAACDCKGEEMVRTRCARLGLVARFRDARATDLLEQMHLDRPAAVGLLLEQPGSRQAGETTPDDGNLGRSGWRGHEASEWRARKGKREGWEARWLGQERDNDLSSERTG
jgi:hypothetical protein